MGLFTRKPKFACDCGMSFPSKDARMAHAAKDHAKAAKFSCNCGTGFGSKTELQNHAKTMHKM